MSWLSLPSSKDIILYDSFHHAMQYSAKRGPAIACHLSVCLSVRLSVTLVDHDHIC